MKDPEETEDWKAWSKPVGWAAGPWRFLFNRSKNMGRNVPTPPGGGVEVRGEEMKAGTGTETPTDEAHRPKGSEVRDIRKKRKRCMRHVGKGDSQI
jgi:hypothetical protein